MTRFENFKAWVKILRPRYNQWMLWPPGPEWIWYAVTNSRTHWADEEAWARDSKSIKPIHKHKY